jgi:hypothetical protein
VTINEVIALITLLVAGASALGGVTWKLVGLIAAVDNRRSENARELYRAIEQVASTLDQKFNRVRDDQVSLSQNMVRRDDLSDDMHRIERTQNATLAAVADLGKQVQEALLQLARLQAAA